MGKISDIKLDPKDFLGYRLDTQFDNLLEDDQSFREFQVRKETLMSNMQRFTVTKRQTLIV